MQSKDIITLKKIRSEKMTLSGKGFSFKEDSSGRYDKIVRDSDGEAVCYVTRDFRNAKNASIAIESDFQPNLKDRIIFDCKNFKNSTVRLSGKVDFNGGICLIDSEDVRLANFEVKSYGGTTGIIRAKKVRLENCDMSRLIMDRGPIVDEVLFYNCKNIGVNIMGYNNSAQIFFAEVDSKISTNIKLDLESAGDRASIVFDNVNIGSAEDKGKNFSLYVRSGGDIHFAQVDMVEEHFVNTSRKSLNIDCSGLTYAHNAKLEVGFYDNNFINCARFAIDPGETGETIDREERVLRLEALDAPDIELSFFGTFDAQLQGKLSSKDNSFKQMILTDVKGFTMNEAKIDITRSNDSAKSDDSDAVVFSGKNGEIFNFIDCDCELMLGGKHFPEGELRGCNIKELKIDKNCDGLIVSQGAVRGLTINGGEIKGSGKVKIEYEYEDGRIFSSSKAELINPKFYGNEDKSINLLFTGENKNVKIENTDFISGECELKDNVTIKDSIMKGKCKAWNSDIINSDVTSSGINESSIKDARVYECTLDCVAKCENSDLSSSKYKNIGFIENYFGINDDLEDVDELEDSNNKKSLSQNRKSELEVSVVSDKDSALEL